MARKSKKITKPTTDKSEMPKIEDTILPIVVEREPEVSMSERRKIADVLWNGLPADSFLESFMYKRFARNFVKHDGNVPKAYRETFGSTGEAIQRIWGKANAILEKPQVQIEIKSLMPSDRDLFDVYRDALNAPTPTQISWGEKLRAADTVAKMKGILGGEEKPNENNTYIMVVEK